MTWKLEQSKVRAGSRSNFLHTCTRPTKCTRTAGKGVQSALPRKTGLEFKAPLIVSDLQFSPVVLLVSHV